MIRFECDYGEGAHQQVMALLAETNMEQTPGYGEDAYCEKAKEYIKKHCAAEDIDIHFLVGGTQTNMTFIASVLRPHQGVVAASTGHINVHESGAIEATGHKVMPIPSTDGKIYGPQVKALYDYHWSLSNHEHEVQPGMVYISQPTENGTLYTKAELEELSEVCRQCGLPLYVDGARLGYGLMSPANDLSLNDLVRLTDAFYIGGTKQGMLFGEALVIVDPALRRDFRYILKQKGGMLAKGRLLGVQYCAMFRENLYFELSDHADKLAMKLKAVLTELGYSFLYESFTNQQFPIMPDETLAKLGEKYAYSFWEKVDDTHTAVRFCMSWATKEEDVDALIADLREVSK